jgi:hypothetical protein
LRTLIERRSDADDEEDDAAENATNGCSRHRSALLSRKASPPVPLSATSHVGTFETGVISVEESSKSHPLRSASPFSSSSLFSMRRDSLMMASVASKLASSIVDSSGIR